MKKQDLPSKICVVCGRPFVWRKKWEKVWDEVRYYGERAVKRAWRSRAMDDASACWTSRSGRNVSRLPRWNALTAWMAQSGCDALVLMAPFVGPDADAWRPVRPTLRDTGLRLVECRRAWDQGLFPAARAGFFPFWHKAKRTLSKRLPLAKASA